jgi:hypothetical protein
VTAWDPHAALRDLATRVLADPESTVQDRAAATEHLLGAGADVGALSDEELDAIEIISAKGAGLGDRALHGVLAKCVKRWIDDEERLRPPPPEPHCRRCAAFTDDDLEELRASVAEMGHYGQEQEHEHEILDAEIIEDEQAEAG